MVELRRRNLFASRITIVQGKGLKNRYMVGNFLTNDKGLSIEEFDILSYSGGEREREKKSEENRDFSLILDLSISFSGINSLIVQYFCQISVILVRCFCYCTHVRVVILIKLF